MSETKTDITAQDVLQQCDLLRSELGKIMTAKEVAAYLGLSEQSVRSKYKAYGGTILSGRYIFTERNLINALQNEEWEMANRRASKWQEDANESVPNQERSSVVRIRREVREIRARDKHGLFG